MNIEQESLTTEWPAWYAALPVAISAAGVLFFDTPDRVLMVRTNYKDDWDIPGGVIEVNRGENPFDAARREIAEELGLDIAIGPLLSIDVDPARENRRPLIAFLFDGGTLTSTDLHQIRFVDNEIAEVRFCDMDQVTQLAAPPLARRVLTTVSLRGAAGPTPAFLTGGMMAVPTVT
ncbi:NUDIX domain-containing protein [Acrocarpospora catenulata]|uniref:NUDIX domain-containing protein n=1 Tax=Acrocarpospora catenulata TaxID=2836182 RepID=UPI001BDA782C|nr:NUDIX hydrolase [Acrocarpospora catenulata]